MYQNYTQLLADWNEKLDYLATLPWTPEKELMIAIVNLHFTGNHIEIN
jgi:hypothetical protein